MNHDFLRAAWVGRESYREDSEETVEEPKAGGRR